MKQYGVPDEEARAQVKKRVRNAWKDINQECLEPRPASMSILMHVVNLARVINLLYSDADCYTDPNKSKAWVKMVLIEPVVWYETVQAWTEQRKPSTMNHSSIETQFWRQKVLHRSCMSLWLIYFIFILLFNKCSGFSLSVLSQIE